jgi:HTH-type transcriptional regulator / antitoxin HipB
VRAPGLQEGGFVGGCRPGALTRRSHLVHNENCWRNNLAVDNVFTLLLTEMKNDVENYIEKRKRADKAFAKDFETGYEQFKIGVMLRQAREAAGVTQEGLARITKTKKSAISRLENHAEDVRLSTVARVARALGKVVRIELVEAS